MLSDSKDSLSIFRIFCFVPNGKRVPDFFRSDSKLRSDDLRLLVGEGSALVSEHRSAASVHQLVVSRIESVVIRDVRLVFVVFGFSSNVSVFSCSDCFVPSCDVFVLRFDCLASLSSFERVRVVRVEHLAVDSLRFGRVEPARTVSSSAVFINSYPRGQI